MIINFCVAEKAMLDIFETWNASNPKLSTVLNWSLSTNPSTDWSRGVDCSPTNVVRTLRYLSYLVHVLISLPKLNVARLMCDDTRNFVGLNIKKMSNQMNIYIILGSTLD